MKNKLIILLPLFLTALILAWGFVGMNAISRTARAANGLYVATTGNDSNDCLSPANACATVNAAIGKASSGNTIHIASGTYTENLNVNINLTFIGAGSSSTILDGGGSSRVLNINSSVVSISNMTIRNGLGGDGGGIYNGGTLTLSQVHIKDNIASNTSGGVWNAGTLTVTNSIFSNNQVTSGQGGAILSDGGPLWLENVSIFGNSNTIGAGGVQVISYEATLTNVTISGNTGFGLLSTGGTTVTVKNSTIVSNSGQGLINYADILIKNSIVANNNAGGDNCAGSATITSQGNNLENGNSCTFNAGGDQINSNPQLLPLGNYGGDTPTHALPFSSPAIDTGSNVDCPATDQRGQTRPSDGNGNSTAVCDIGAYELIRVAPNSVSIGGDIDGLLNSNYTFQATTSPTTTTQPITYTWQADGQTTSIRSGKGYTDTITFNWPSTGDKTITVTVDNGLGTQVNTHQINISSGTQAVTGVTISGPSSGSQNQAYSFSATVAPGSATTPITYTWQVDGGTPIVQTGQGTSASLNGITFNSDGAHTISVTANNGTGSASDSYNIAITSWYVNDATGNDANDCQSAGNACKTLWQAIFNATDGGTIFIADGTYSVNEMDVMNKNLFIIGSSTANTILDGGGSGAVFWLQNSGGSLAVTMSDLTIRNGNRSASDGGGIYSDKVNLTLRRVLLVNNRSAGSGAAIFNNVGTLTISDSIIRGNTTSASNGSGLVNYNGTLIISNTAVINNNGSAIHSYNSSNATLTNVTISGNEDGFVMDAGSTATAVNVTIAHNQGAGLSNYGTFNAKNSLFANNNNGNCATGSALAPTSQGYNLDSGNSCALSATGDMSNTNPGLLPLAPFNNTWLHAFPANSPLLDKGSNNGCPATDQAGVTRPKDGDNNSTAVCDIGAFEYDPANIPQAKVYLPMIIRP